MVRPVFSGDQVITVTTVTTVTITLADAGIISNKSNNAVLFELSTLPVATCNEPYSVFRPHDRMGTYELTSTLPIPLAES